MKVYIVTGEPFPNGMAATNRIRCYARAISEGGIPCEVLIYRRTEVYGSRVKNSETLGKYEGVPFRYTARSTSRNKYQILRYFIDKWERRSTERYLSKNLKKGDVLLLFLGRPVSVAMRFMDVAHKNGAYCVRDLCELPYGTGAETEQAIRLRKKTIETQFPQLDGIISISDALLNLARTYTLPSCRHIKVPIMVEYEQYKLDKKPEATSIPYIFHAGTLYEQKDGILGMIEAFGLAKQKINRPLEYYLTGTVNQSSHPNEIKSLLKKYNIEDSVHFVGYLYRDQIKEYLKRASLVISNRPKSQQDYYGFSTKLGEYLASATPLLLTNWGEAVNWLEDGKTAIITEPEDTEALADAIVRVFEQPVESRSIGLAGQEVCKSCFDYRNWSKPLVEFFNQLGK